MALLYVAAAWIAAGAAMAARTVWRERRRIPAAPDNQPGHDTAALQTCRHISALSTTSRKENPQP
jgi:hypothetical protein